MLIILPGASYMIARIEQTVRLDLEGAPVQIAVVTDDPPYEAQIICEPAEVPNSIDAGYMVAVLHALADALERTIGQIAE